MTIIKGALDESLRVALPPAFFAQAAICAKWGAPTTAAVIEGLAAEVAIPHLCELQQRRVAAHLFSTFALARAALRASPRKARGGSHTAALGPTASSFVATRSSSSAS